MNRPCRPHVASISDNLIQISAQRFQLQFRLDLNRNKILPSTTMADSLTDADRISSSPSGVSEQDNSAPAAKLHPVWNFETVVFQVENELFCIPKKGLSVPGSTFEDMFALSLTSGPGVEGQSLANPIILPQTRASDFSALLTLLYPWINMYDGSGGLSEVPHKYLKEARHKNTKDFGLDHWLGVLRLANKWNYDGVRETAIDALGSLLPRGIERIQAGREYFVQTWVKEGYHDIVSTRGLDPDKLAEAPYNFGQATIAKIFYIQVASLAHLGGVYCHSDHGNYHWGGSDNADCDAIRESLKDAYSLIDTTFEDDIKAAYYGGPAV
ncbi:hypothetical protein D9619_004411 [Psilocybe cf. subviscida]|uniref:BTB domain-containing protein n=1 Tax=Psilocybe cf. subviscida TaxID=2480587 RepID=A0A8H5BP33_9AGAR|nr:hypothetical protein D9619_004411 [Psilocybe cf. subviscida]